VNVAPCTAADNVARPYIADEVAELLRLKRRTVIELAKAGELPVIRVGKCFRFPRTKIDRIVAGELDTP